MCLIHNPFDLSDLPKTFTTFKVYRKVGSFIESPYYPFRDHGCIITSGTFSVPATIITANPEITILDASGFHSLLNKEDAYAYLQYLEYRSFKIGFENRNFVIAPVEINKTHVILTGKTDVYLNKKYPKTIVSHTITITQETFKQAISN